MKRSRRLPTTALTGLALLGAVTFASAASLPLDGGVLSAVEAGHPCPGTAAVTATTGGGTQYSAVSVTMPAGCAGRQLTVRMTSGTTVLSGTAGVAGTGPTVVSFAPTSYDATSAWTIQAVVDGWDLPATWSFTGPPYWCTVVTSGSTATCTAAVTIFTGVKPGGSSSATYYDVVVTTSSSAAVRWEVTFDLDHEFYGTRPTRLGNSTLDGYFDGATNWTANDVTRVSACSALPLLSVRGDNVGWGNNFRDVRDIRVRQFSLVVNRTEAGYFDVLYPGCW